MRILHALSDCAVLPGRARIAELRRRAKPFLELGEYQLGLSADSGRSVGRPSKRSKQALTMWSIGLPSLAVRNSTAASSSVKTSSLPPGGKAIRPGWKFRRSCDRVDERERFAAHDRRMAAVARPAATLRNQGRRACGRYRFASRNTWRRVPTPRGGE